MHGVCPHICQQTQCQLLFPWPACRGVYMMCWHKVQALCVVSWSNLDPRQSVGHRWRLACPSMHWAGNSPALVLNSALQSRLHGQTAGHSDQVCSSGRLLPACQKVQDIRAGAAPARADSCALMPVAWSQ